MKEEILEIIIQHKYDHISSDQAVNELLSLFTVGESACQCEHPTEAIIRDGNKDFCLACNQQIDR